MYSELLGMIRTNFDRDLLLSEIEALKQAIYEPSEGGVEKALSANVRASVAQAIRNDLKGGGDYENYLLGLEKALGDMEEVRLGLAVEPTEDFLSQIYDWISASVGKNHIIQIDIDNRILGGAKISYKGRYLDYSLAKILHADLASMNLRSS